MENVQWIFSGIGTELLSLVLGALCGGIIGYRIGVKKNSTQKQVAKNGSTQRQDVEIACNAKTNVNTDIEQNITQTQRAGNNSQQVQTGRMNNGQ